MTSIIQPPVPTCRLAWEGLITNASASSCDPAFMASARRQAIQAGREPSLPGRMSNKRFPSGTSPLARRRF